MTKKDLKIRNIPGPEGVRGRNSDNSLIKKVLGWAPATKLVEGLKVTYDWIKAEVAKEVKAGRGKDLATSKIVVQSTESIDNLGKCPGKKIT